MIAFYTTILVGSIVGSLHCVAMCGPLVAIAAGRRSVAFAMIHALGRLVTYATFGAIAGAVGRAVDVAGRMGAVQHAASIAAAVVIIAWGGWSVAVTKGWRRGATTTAPTLLARGLVQLRRRKPATRAWIVGLMTGLVPCGWLWAFVVSAAGTGSALVGASVMAVFWLGTVPAMTGALVVAGPLVGALRARLPVVTAITLAALALGTLALRWDTAGAAGITHPTCHHAEGT